MIPKGVTNIRDYAFENCFNLTSVTVPVSVSVIGYEAFSGCPSLTAVRFEGNAPNAYNSEFGAERAAVYYVPGTVGWSRAFCGRPTVMWLPQVLSSDANFGIRTNNFGFNISWARDKVVIIEACVNLASNLWYSVGTNNLSSGSSYFWDPTWTNYQGRFYRLRSL